MGRDRNRILLMARESVLRENVRNGHVLSESVQNDHGRSGLLMIRFRLHNASDRRVDDNLCLPD